jgi:predicted GNAT superfamily acetyltransferase
VTTWSPQDDLGAAEQRADVKVRSLLDLSELDDARWVFDTVWPSLGGSTQIQPNLLRAQIHAGGYASAAYRNGEPIGAAFAFVGRHHDDGWHTHLHSHMAAVLEPYRDQHVGAALKMHQRVWALEHELDTIVWTFDPLVRRNAVLNLIKLGVDVRGFEVNFYGAMDDGINAGDPTDRLFAWWRLQSPRAVSALRGELSRIDVAGERAAGRDLREIPLPDDIVGLRSSDPASAGEWRLTVREALSRDLVDGYGIVGVSTGGGYVLERVS